MFDDRSNLSSELEWMLSSTQAEPAEVRRAVAQEYGQALYSMALSLLSDPALASAAFAEILAAVPANRHRYSAQAGIRNWLYSLAVEVCRRYRERGLRSWRRPPVLENDLAGLGTGSPAVKRATGVNHQVWDLLVF
jgi:DNA-directed RNA polymerase specialized sigma24 family protein